MPLRKVRRKPLAYAVAFTLYDSPGKKRFLVIQRPSDDDEHPDMWGFPATMMKPGELPEHALIRAGSEKLGIEIEPIGFTGAIAQERSKHILYLMHFETVLKEGQPDVKKASTTGTRYQDCKWTSDPKVLFPIAEKGSICVQLYLHKRNLWPREKFIYRLEF